MKYLPLILIIIGIILSMIIGNFIVQQYAQYKQFKKDFEEFRQATIQQVSINTQNIGAIVNFINTKK